MTNLNHTVRFQFDNNDDNDVGKTLLAVYRALEDKGYNPINQIVGYLLSGDPAYIPRHQDARNLIKRLERDEILEELLVNYLNTDDQ